MKLQLIAACMLLIEACYGQSKRYDIGDCVPSLHSPTGLSNLHGKLIILDFWSLSCHSCISSMPRLDSLQEQFKDRLQVIMVTRDKQRLVEKFFARHPIRKPRVPLILEDTLLSGWFPYDYVPHHVWIDETGMVVYITGGENTNFQTLHAYFNGASFDFNKQVALQDFDLEQPLWQEGGGRLSKHVKFYSMFSGFIAEYPFPYTRITDDVPGITHVKLLNTPLLELYKKAYGGLRNQGELAQDDRIVLEVRDTSVFRQSDPLKLDAFVRNHSYCYEAESPPVSESEFCRVLQQELARYFPYEVTIEKRLEPVNPKDKNIGIGCNNNRRWVDMLIIRDKCEANYTAQISNSTL